MARLCVYRDQDDRTLLVDCQSDLLDHLKTRLVVPLLEVSQAVDRRLNPPITIDGTTYVFAPQYMAAVPASILREKVAWLRDHEYEIGRALDLMFGGV